MTTLPLSDIIRDSFAKAWRYKYLWLFGLFAGGGSGGIQIPGGDSGSGFGDMEEIQAWVLAAVAALALVAIAVALIVLVLHTICKLALIYNVYQIETGGAHSISGGWDFALKRFWPMLGLTITEWFVLFAFVVTLVLAEVAIFVISIVLGIVSLLVALPLLFFGVAVILVTWTYAERFLALESRGVVDSLGEAWALVKSEWRPTVNVLLVKIAIAIALGIAGLVAMMVLILPAVALWLVSEPLAIVYGVLVLVPYVVVVGGYFGTFDYMVWTKVFLHLRAPAYAAAASPAPTSPSGPESTPPPIFE